MNIETTHREAAVLPSLESPCAHCGGKGGWTSDGWQYDCEDCDGTGYVLTEFGKEVMAFVKHAATRLQRHG